MKVSCYFLTFFETVVGLLTKLSTLFPEIKGGEFDTFIYISGPGLNKYIRKNYIYASNTIVFNKSEKLSDKIQ